MDRPTSAEPPEPPAPARSHAVEELRSKLPGISEAHAGTHGVVVFDSSSSKTASLNADRHFVAASLSKLYALLTHYIVVVFSEDAPEEEAREMIQDISLAAYRTLSRSGAR